MNYIRNFHAIALVVIILMLSTFNTVSADSNVIYEIKGETTPITTGAVLQNIKHFTDDGWLNINVLKVDVTNPNIKVDTIINTESIRTVSSTKTFAQTNSAVAAINGGFFEWPTKNSPGVYNPIGPMFSKGQLLTASGDYNVSKDTFATLSVNNLNEIMQNYWKVDMQLTVPGSEPIKVHRYNRPFYGNRDLTILDRKWSTKSIGTDTPVFGCIDILEMVVVDGIVTEIRQSQPSVEIPENGYVVITRSGEDWDKRIINSFKVGDQVKFKISSTPDWSNMKTVINGGAILLKDGIAEEKFTHIPEGTRSTRNPRTAVGSSKDGKVLFMVTVDGRLAGGSIGATLTELAQIMKELGAYNAINLDGGGSTTMVARTPGTGDLNSINTPSDGFMRKVNSAIGVFSTAEPTNVLYGLFIDTEDDNVFINTSRAFTLRGYDKYYNPVPIDMKNVKWSISGVKGTFKDNVFYPKSLGRGKIKATVGKVSKEIEISVLSSPVQLILSQSTLKLPLNQSKSITVKGKNVNGYYAAIDPSDVKWTVKGRVGTLSKNTFTAAKQGVGYIDAAVGKTHAYCTVSVQVERTATVDKFDYKYNSSVSYPESVPASYELSEEQKHSGRMSGKLSYDFSNIEGTRAAYIVLRKDGIPLYPTTSRFGLWVYNTHENPNWLGAWVTDTKGKQHQIYFTKEMDWVGWKYVEVSLDGIDSPAKLTRIYLVQPNPVSDIGEVYFDDLSVTTSTYPFIDMNKIPKDTVPTDGANKTVTYKKSSSSFRFAVFGQSKEPENSLEKSLVTNFVKKVNSSYEASAFVGQSTHEGAKTVKKTLIATNTGYKSYDVVNSRFIQLDMSKDGLRTTDSKQWHWLINQLDTTKGNNIFLFLADSPDSFSDSKEAKLFKNILTEYKKKTRKNIWVFYKGDKNASSMEEGIKYISTAGYEVDGLTQKTTNLAKYIVVTVKGNAVTYEFKSIV